MPGIKENKDFVDAIMPLYALDDALDWIRNNLNPEDVFTKESLELWAEDNGFIQEGDR